MSKEILFFSSNTCAPCRQVKNRLNENAENYSSFKILDAEKDFEEFIKHKVSGVPTFVVLENNVEVKRKIGIKNLKDLEEL